MMDPEEVQEKAISQMTARIIKEDEVVGPTTAVSRSTQAPSRAPSPAPSRRSRSASSGSSSTSRTEVKRQRAGPAQQKVPVIPIDTPRATTQQFFLDFGLVVKNPHFDLEKVENAFAADKTVTTAAKMSITTSKDLDQMKDIMRDVLDPGLEVCIEGNTFAAEPPKRRRRTRGQVRKAKANVAMAASSSTQRVAQRVAVVLTPGPGPRSSPTSTPKSAAQSKKKKCRHRGPRGPPRLVGTRPPSTPPPAPFSAWTATLAGSARAMRPRGAWAAGPPRRPPTPPWRMDTAPPASAAVGARAKPAALMPPPGLEPNSLASTQAPMTEFVSVRSLEVASVRNQDLARLLRSLAVVIHPWPSAAPGTIRRLRPEPVSGLPQTPSIVFDEL